jgi:biotin carboxyl carrier protein
VRLRLAVDGELFDLEVDLEKGEVRKGGLLVPVKVLQDEGGKVELEVGAERHVIEGWPPSAEPMGPHPLVVNRERYRLEVVEYGEEARAKAPAAPATPSPRVPAPAAAAPTGPGTAVTPPMPGKILEVRVKEGEAIQAGQILLVLEAMKMRNEILSPSAGKVTGLSATPGQSVKAKEVLLRVVPA